MAIADVDTAALDRGADFFKDRCMFTKVDVSKRADVDGWIEAVVTKFGKLDGKANCAGIIGKHRGTRGVAELDDGQW